ncbi:MAG: STAS domain-containing protein [Terrimicrobiaceae bacterium]|nr:STAS domain-containing protein [Terrimicrobiaceae bacterium]
MKLEIEVTRQTGAVIAALKGSINAANAEEAAASLLPLAQAGGRLVLDASRLEFISSAGLRLLLRLQRAAADAGGRLVLAGLSPEVSEVMLVTGFLQHFVHAETLAEALAE